ncbi:hypothetical protein HG531_013308 [Fusarium graminearum]|nr:hypothetical protein HG531_013308 [Fusarium graminearum]
MTLMQCSFFHPSYEELVPYPRGLTLDGFGIVHRYLQIACRDDDHLALALHALLVAFAFLQPHLASRRNTWIGVELVELHVVPSHRPHLVLHWHRQLGGALAGAVERLFWLLDDDDAHARLRMDQPVEVVDARVLRLGGLLALLAPRQLQPLVLYANAYALIFGLPSLLVLAAVLPLLAAPLELVFPLRHVVERHGARTCVHRDPVFEYPLPYHVVDVALGVLRP